jgi:hypothetical protein
LGKKDWKMSWGGGDICEKEREYFVGSLAWDNPMQKYQFLKSEVFFFVK